MEDEAKIDARLTYEQGRAADSAHTRLYSLGYMEHDVEKLKLTDEQRDAIYAATRMLANVCDGAVLRDDVGFNATDTRLGRRLGMLPQHLWDDVAYFVMYHTLQKYSRQLGGSMIEKIRGE